MPVLETIVIILTAVVTICNSTLHIMTHKKEPKHKPKEGVKDTVLCV